MHGHVCKDIVPRRRAEQYSKPKIVFAKLGLTLEAFFDERGDYAALNVNFAFPAREEGHFYNAQLNSTLGSWVYRQMFGALSMGGNYMQFQAPQLKAMLVTPFVAANPNHIELASLAQAIAEGGCGTGLHKRIDDLVEQLFEMSTDERTMVHESTE